MSLLDVVRRIPYDGNSIVEERCKDENTYVVYDTSCYTRRVIKTLKGPLQVLTWKGTKIPTKVEGCRVRIDIDKDTDLDFKVSDIFTEDELYDFGILQKVHFKYVKPEDFNSARCLSSAAVVERVQEYWEYRNGPLKVNMLSNKKNTVSPAGNMLSSVYVNGFRVPSLYVQQQTEDRIKKYPKDSVIAEQLFDKQCVITADEMGQYVTEYRDTKPDYNIVTDWTPELLEDLLREKHDIYIVHCLFEDMCNPVMNMCGSTPFGMFRDMDLGWALDALEDSTKIREDELNLHGYFKNVEGANFLFLNSRNDSELVYVANVFKDLDVCVLSGYELTCVPFFPDCKIICTYQEPIED